MKQVFHSCLFLLLISLSSMVIRNPEEKLQKIRIETEYGTMIAVLYNDTPGHRDNFLTNIKNKIYDDLLWHRVIKEFMIQGGDPDSKKAVPGQVLGNGNLGYTIPAEFRPNRFHKKGALAAARTGDDINPNKESSSSQFYIVQGKTFDEGLLKKIEERTNHQTRNKIFNELLALPENSVYLDTIKAAMNRRDQAVIQTIYQKLSPTIEKILEQKGKFTFSDEQLKAYQTIGGAPHLDGSYTVFGEVIEGLEVIDKIAVVATDGNARPLADLKMKITLVEE